MGISTGIGLAGLPLAGCIGSSKPDSTSVPGQLSVDPVDLLNSSPLMVSLTDFQDTSEFAEDAVYDTSFSTPGNKWSRSLMLAATASGNKNATTEKAKFLSPDGNLNQYEMWVNIDQPENLATLRIYFIGPGPEDYYDVHFDVKNLVYRQQLLAGQWCRIRTLMVEPNIHGSPDPKHFNKVQIQLTTTGPCTVHMNDLRVMTPPQWLANGAVMIVCDGGYISQYTGIKASLDRYGYKAIVAVSSKYYGDSNYMAAAQLKDLFDGGWDIGVHGSNPIPTDQMTEEALDQLWRDEFAWISARGIRPVRFLAAPEGVWSPTIEKVAKRYFLLTRCSMESYNSALPQYPMYVKEPTQGSTSLEMAKSWVDTAKANHYMICLLMHGIYPDGNTGGWYDQASFDALIDYIHAQGMPVITSKQLWGHLNMPLSLD